MAFHFQAYMPSSYTARIETKKITDLAKRCVVAFVWKKDNFVPPSLPLTILFDSTIKMISRIVMYPILKDPIERNVGSLEADFGEF